MESNVTETEPGRNILDHHAHRQIPVSSNSLWESLQSALPGIHLAYLYLENFTRAVVKGMRSSFPADTFTEQSLLDLVTAQPCHQWISLPLKETPLGKHVHLLRLPCGDHRESALLLEWDGGVPDKMLLRELQWCCLALGFAYGQERLGMKLRNSQNLVNYQLIYLESIEWLKSVDRQDLQFYRHLLERMRLLTDADAVDLLSDDLPVNAGEEGVGRGMDNTTREALLHWLEQHKRDPVDSHFLNYLSSGDSELKSLAFEHVLIASFNHISFTSRGHLVLVRSKKKSPFSAVEEMYINQYLSLAANTLERNTLLNEVEQRNQLLLEEQSKQQALIEKLQTAQNQLLQSEKMASIGQLAAGVAHEINNPIGYVMSNLSTLGQYVQTLWQAFGELSDQYKQDVSDSAAAVLGTLQEKFDLEYLREDLDSLLRETREGTDRVKRIVQDLKDFSRADSGEFQVVDLVKCIEKTLNIVHNELKYKAEVVCEFDELPLVEMVESQVSQVIMNLLVNAAHAIESRGTITITARLQRQQMICVSVTDTGSGIKPEYQSKIFDPFFTSKPVGKGTGLGLSISYGIMQRHHGRIEFTTEVGKGTTFFLYLPVSQPQKDEAR